MEETKLDKCIEIMQDTSNKADKMISEYQTMRSESKSKDNIIKWLVTSLTVFIVTAGIVAGIFVYGYMYSPYLAGDITTNGNGDGNQVVAIG